MKLINKKKPFLELIYFFFSFIPLPSNIGNRLHKSIKKLIIHNFFQKNVKKIIPNEMNRNCVTVEREMVKKTKPQSVG